MTTMPLWITSKEVFEIFNLSKRDLDRLLKEKAIIRKKLGTSRNNKCVYLKESIENYLLNE